VIRSIKDKKTARVWNREHSPRLPEDIQERALMKLQQIHAAGNLQDLSIPVSNHLEPLRGEREGVYSIRVNRQWRIRFLWKGGHAFDVEIVDYH
jgi:toxin HigB-1